MHRRNFLVAATAPSIFVGAARAADPAQGDAALARREVLQFDFVKNDAGSGANDDVQIYRPRRPEGHAILGDTAVGGKGAPKVNTYALRELNRALNEGSDPIMVPPEGLILLFGYIGGGGLAFFQPVPPPGYVALGAVVGGAPLTDYACIRKDWVTRVAPNTMAPAYSSAGSRPSNYGSPRWGQVTLWTSTQLPGAFFVQEGHYGQWSGTAYRPLTNAERR